MAPTSRSILGVMLLIAIAACGDAGNRTDSATTSADTSSENTAPTGTVDRQEVPPPANTVERVQQQALQTQPGPGGSQVALNKVAVTGDVLTVQLTYQGGTGVDYPAVDEVSVIDDATAQRLGVLKDNGGRWLAAPMWSNGKELRIEADGPSVVWFKFPAPPGSTQTVSITIPNVGPFDGVPVTR